MSAGPRFAWHRGEVRPIEDCTVSVLDRGLLFGEAVYDVLPVIEGRPRLRDEHLTRMRGGAAALSIGAAIPNDDDFDALATALLRREALTEGILYLQATGGAGPRAHVPEPRPAPTFFAFCQALLFPRAVDAARPRDVALAPDPRWARCDLKTTMLLPAIMQRHQAPTAEEIVFVDGDGNLTEGGSTCVFVVSQGAVVLPALSARVLPSITRALVEQEAAAVGLGVSYESISVARLRGADEVGLASTTKLVLGIGSVDGEAVAHRVDGVCGQLAARLRRRYGIDADRE